ncbi:unnamed protein product, partial [Prunus brigantina]
MQPLDSTWYPDTGATHHMTGSSSNLQNQQPYQGNNSVFLGNGDSLSISHTGSLPLPLGSHQFSLKNVFCLPSLRTNLLSVARFTRDNLVFFVFTPDFYQIYDLRTGSLLFQGPSKDGLYPLSISSHSSTVPRALTTVHSPAWHRRLGHPSHPVLSHLAPSLGFKVSNAFCKDCALSKSTKLSFLSNTTFAPSPFYLIHSDVWMSPVNSSFGYRYYVLFTDDFSRYSWLYPMHRKNEVFSHFQTFLAMVKNQFHTTVQILQSDNGTEYVNNAFSDLCSQLGIHQRFSCPHTPQQNGLAERKHRHIATMIRTLLTTSQTPHNLWVEAALIAVHLINLLPTPNLQWDTPYNRLFQHPPSYSHLRVFGCSCFPYLGPYTENKLTNRTLECVFLGYSSHHKGYRCLHPSTGRVYTSRHVLFNEMHFPFEHLQVSSSSEYVDIEFHPILPSTHVPISITSAADSASDSDSQPYGTSLVRTFPAAAVSSHDTAATSGPLTSTSSVLSQPLLQTYSRLPAAPNPPVPAAPNPPVPAAPTSLVTAAPNPHVPAAPQSSAPVPRMRTRLQDGIHKPKLHTDGIVKYPIPRALLTVVEHTEPTCFSQATKHTEWRDAMTEEINALLKNHTWTLVPSFPSQNLVGCKWVFRIKRHSDGSIERYKARLIAKGFHQRPGIDYAETFSPVVKPATIRTVLSLAVSRGWSLRQLDVKNAFLHGFLQEDVYMAQPPGFIDPTRPSYVCKLHKALYGLKQAPRAWFHRISTFLLSVGFTRSQADTSLFIFQQASYTIFLLLYVDDIVVTGSDSTHLQQFISLFGAHFDIKDLGPLSYFLGLQVLHQNGTLHINQLKYAHDLLQKANLLNSKPASTPLAAKVLLSVSDGALISNPTEYRELVGSLQYLTLTRPDISFAVNTVAQFMSAPRTPHLVAAKRILRYIKGTIDLGLSFTPQPAAARLSAYSDADWAGCPDSRRSTIGYVITLGTNLISWCSKKQPTVSRSSTESEYRALSHACAETNWLCSLLHEPGVRLRFPVQLFCDNLGTTYLAANPVFHARTRHIELDYHFVREKVALGSHQVCFIPSVDQPADLFTKDLHKSRHQLLSSKLVHP